MCGRIARRSDFGDCSVDFAGREEVLVAKAGVSSAGHGDRAGRAGRDDGSDAATSRCLHRTRPGSTNIIFCIAVSIALFTGRRWVEEVPEVEFDTRRPSLFTLTVLSIVVLYVQLILGGMFRHRGMSWWPHVAHAVVVAFVLTWTAVRAVSRCTSGISKLITQTGDP